MYPQILCGQIQPVLEQLQEKCCSTDCSEIAEKRRKSMRDKVTDKCLLGTPLFMQKSLVEMCSLIVANGWRAGPQLPRYSFYKLHYHFLRMCQLLYVYVLFCFYCCVVGL